MVDESPSKANPTWWTRPALCCGTVVDDRSGVSRGGVGGVEAAGEADLARWTMSALNRLWYGGGWALYGFERG